ncbi:family 16 glycosylhydrolase [Flavobacterium sp. WG21]|uniref:glycoside hydrolase family 16 protein n=1 Tax=Flavobacterium sp. WG21 TaxID=1229487 RepID=UPI00034AD353|nr:glycoside hydrolase family 16 protein [Flavobacterium sp. WG21]
MNFIKPTQLLIIFISICLISCDSKNEEQSVLPESNNGIEESAIIAQGYTKVFEENFTTDLNKWNIWIGGAYNDELQHYQASNLGINNGNLEIKAKKETVTGVTDPENTQPKKFEYTSGRIESKFEIAPTASKKKVRISARIKLPAGYGMWPAFWSYGDPWPTHGEIDILEALGQDHNSYIINYYYGTTEGYPLTNNDLTTSIIHSEKDLTQDYHLYEVIWEQNSLTFLLDGKIINTKLSSNPGNKFISEFFNKPQHIVLNTAIGGNMFDNFNPELIQTGVLYVDWVKVFVSN